MHLNSFPSILFIFLVLLIDFTVCKLSKDDEISMHSNCRVHRLNCGNLLNLSFPFWGNNRPDYCGFPGFKLDCGDGSPEIEINSVRYQVLTIDQSIKNMRIARADFVGDACPWRFGDTTFGLIQGRLDYSSGVVNLTLFYDCPASNETSYKFKCQTTDDGGINEAYFGSESMGIGPNMSTTISCRKKINVLIMQAALGRLLSDPSSLLSLLREGFNVSYNVGIFSAYSEYCSEAGGECGFVQSSFRCLCPKGTFIYSDYECLMERGWSKFKKTVIGAVIGGTGMILVFFVLLLIFWLKNRSLSHKIAQRKIEDFFKDYGSIAPKKFKYKDVKKMTNSFKEKLGQGGYGAVFKGHLHDGRLVAVKVLFNNKSKSNDGEEFMNEVFSISRTCHVNVVALLGFCFNGKKKALIYEFMPNGSLDKFIYNGNRSESSLMLGWETLYQIAIGIARGLEYLHRGCTTRILHFDIKPHNILLDKEFRPKISDFGLAKLCPGTESIISMLGTRGTVGYIAPEVFSRNFGGVSHKSDVYSYGMMVLEMVGGRKNIDVKVGMDHSSQLYFPHWIHDRLKLKESLGLHGIMTEEREKAARKMIVVGLWCIQTNQSNRPSMSKVLEMLEGSVETLPIPPKPFLSSPPRSPLSPDSSTTISLS